MLASNSATMARICRNTTLKSTVRNGLPSPTSTALEGSSTVENSRTRLSFTPNTASESRYGVSATNRCVVTVRMPGADASKWMCAGRFGCREVARRSSPTVPSSGMG
jgi:hypothetical protein